MGKSKSQGPHMSSVSLMRYTGENRREPVPADVSFIRFTIVGADGRERIVDVETTCRDGVEGLTIRSEEAMAVLPLVANTIIVRPGVR